MWEQPLGPLSSNTTTRLFLAGTLRFPGTNPQGLFLVALPLGLLSCNPTGLLFHAETLSLGLLLPAQPLRLLGSSALGQL